MADFTGTTTVSAPPQAVFDYLSEVSSLPDYFARLTTAEAGEGEEVHTTATLEDGQKVEGDAWFRVTPADRLIEWGSEGPSSYSGRLRVSSAGDGSKIEVSLHTTRVSDGDTEVQNGISDTLDNIKDRLDASSVHEAG